MKGKAIMPDGDNTGKTLVRHQIMNPRGRPKVQKDLQRQCVKWWNEGGWEMIQDFLNGGDRKIAWDVAKTLLAYGFGRPPEKIEIETHGEEVMHLEEFNTADLKRALSELDKKGGMTVSGGTVVDAEVVPSADISVEPQSQEPNNP